MFGGGGGFTFYACDRFGSRSVIYNDHNPVITNLINTLKTDPEGLFVEYQKHAARSGPEHYLHVRKMDLVDGTRGAGRFYYLAKNAFSGKIRFNLHNKFNSPMRKSAKCPKIKLESLLSLSKTIRHLTITEVDFQEYKDVSGGFMYLDPPYMNNTNGHYNATVPLNDFVNFVRSVEKSNAVMISEQNGPALLELSAQYMVFKITLNRSLQYFTQKKSREIIAVNYKPPNNY